MKDQSYKKMLSAIAKHTDSIDNEGDDIRNTTENISCNVSELNEKFDKAVDDYNKALSKAVFAISFTISFTIAACTGILIFQKKLKKLFER